MVSELEVQNLLEEDRKLDFPSIGSHRGIMLSSSRRRLFLLFLSKERLKSSQNLICIDFVVEISNKILALFSCDISMNPFVDGIVDLHCVFVGHFCFDVHFEEIIDGSFELSLHKSELLIHFIS